MTNPVTSKRHSVDFAEGERLFTSFATSAFRFEGLPQYGVDEEQEELDLFLQGRPLPPDGNEDWCRVVSQNISSGKTMVRARVLTDPLTIYLRYEIAWGYLYSASAGEDIRMISAGVPAEARLSPQGDFWLFDDTTVLYLNYDENGNFQGLEISEDKDEISACRRVRNTALDYGVPITQYLSEIRQGHDGCP